MPSPDTSPDDQTLQAFLRGTLPEDRVAAVQAWLEANPSALARLGHLPASDEFIERPKSAESADTPSPASLAVERMVRATAAAPRKTSYSTVAPAPGETDSPPVQTDLQADDRTIPQAQPLTAPVLPSWAPARLGSYRLIRELGHGGMGYVFEAEDEKLDRRVAVKVLHPDLKNHPDAASRFLREARAAAAIEHENVVPVLHVGEEADLPFIVLPLLKGESLDKRLKRGTKLAAAEVARIGRDVAAGLAAAHANGRIHRDLKPANVWLDEKTGRALVLDFGLARLSDGSDALTQSGITAGTPAYMAPEQIDGHTPAPRADLFSLGATLYECAVGQKPFRGPSLTALLKAVATHHPPPPAAVSPAIPAALSDLIMRLMAKSPADRPASAAEVQAALSSFLSMDCASTITGHDLAPRPSRPYRRFALVCAMIAAAVLLTGGLWLANGPSPVADSENPLKADVPAVTPSYRGKVDVLVERGEGDAVRLRRLNEPGALPLKATDKFRIEGEVDPPAYLYVVWVDPDRDVTPIYPWDPRVGWGSRPETEQRVGKISLPPNVGNRYTAPKAKPGVATIVLLARSTPLEASDEEVKTWFESLPDLPLPPSGEEAAIWFDDFVEARDPLRLRTFGEVGSDDAFARWQGELQRALGAKVSFQTAVSFARTGQE